ncbi:MAG TPA: shikimate dehydrogenase [Bacteroidales bacterium]|nr:shikimate dehydrogenase [Bacteroidales bacterium]
MKQYGLIGLPLEHSFSKKYFTKKFAKENTNVQYELYELENILQFKELIKNENLCGLNVTIPYKELIIPYLDEVDEVAAKIGAVNVIKFIRENETLKLKGFNSDAVGFENSIKPFLKSPHKKALILGTGGASKAIEFILGKLGIEVKFVSRSVSENKLIYSDLDGDILSEYLLVVNATPLGTFPNVNTCPDIPYEFLTERHLLFDVVYNPAETLFMKKGKERGATVLNGEEMLIGQAEEAWRIWNS